MHVKMSTYINVPYIYVDYLPYIRMYILSLQTLETCTCEKAKSVYAHVFIHAEKLQKCISITTDLGL